MSEVTLMLGDCLELMKALPDASVNLILTDPPYGITANKWDVMPDMAAWWQEAHRVCSGAIVMTASQPFTSLMVTSNLKRFKHEWIWQKNTGGNFMNTMREPFKEHESVLVFAASGWIYNPQREARRGEGESRAKYTDSQTSQSSSNYRTLKRREITVRALDRLPSSVQKFNTERGLHPTQKPVALFRYLVNTYSNCGDTVLDCYMGSGTTGVACAELGRNFIGMELDANYYEIAKARIEAAQSQAVMGFKETEVSNDVKQIP